MVLSTTFKNCVKFSTNQEISRLALELKLRRRTFLDTIAELRDICCCRGAVIPYRWHAIYIGMNANDGSVSCYVTYFIRIMDRNKQPEMKSSGKGGGKGKDRRGGTNIETPESRKQELEKMKKEMEILDAKRWNDITLKSWNRWEALGKKVAKLQRKEKGQGTGGQQDEEHEEDENLESSDEGGNLKDVIPICLAPLYTHGSR